MHCEKRMVAVVEPPPSARLDALFVCEPEERDSRDEQSELPSASDEAAAAFACCERIREHFYKGGLLTVGAAIDLLARATATLKEEPNVLMLEDPITICGDVHGQYYDLMTLFRLGGKPGEAQYLFLGDYVDRGSFSTEVALYIFALKVHFPNLVWLLRGNHECRQLTTYFNFKEECLHKYDADVYNSFMECFDCLPLAAIVNNVFLCVHGGISPNIKCIDDIRLINRFCEPPSFGPMCDLLWADPMEDDEERICPEALFLHNEMRGCSFVFSHAAASRFLAENNMVSLIRAHEAQDEGFRMFRKVADTGFPAVMCIFSAPNYCDSYNNKGSILQLTKGNVLHVKQFYSVPHPYCLPNFLNAFAWSMPFLCDKLTESGTFFLHSPLISLFDGGQHQQQHVGGKAPSIIDAIRKRGALAAGASVIARRGRFIKMKVMAVVKFRLLFLHVRSKGVKN